MYKIMKCQNLLNYFALCKLPRAVIAVRLSAFHFFVLFTYSQVFVLCSTVLFYGE